MGKTKKNAKLAAYGSGYGDRSPFTIEINGYVYGFDGMSELEGVGEAIELHIDEDKEFTDFINLFKEDMKIRKFYAPAMLCGLGHLGKDALLDFLMDSILGEEIHDES